MPGTRRSAQHFLQRAQVARRGRRLVPRLTHGLADAAVQRAALGHLPIDHAVTAADLLVGTRVLAQRRELVQHGGIGDEPGSYAEYTTLHEEYCAAAPAGISLQDAAALPLVCITAWEALFERANLTCGQTILIHGAAGGVGHIAVQLASRCGARVATTVSDANKASLAHALGAAKIIDYNEQDFVRETLSWTDGLGADVVFDTVGGDTFLKSFGAVRIGGKLVSLLATPMSLADAQLARLRNLSLCYELMLTPQVLKLHEARIRQRKILEQCAKRIEAGELGVLVAHRFPLDMAADAHRLLEQGGITGKIILTIG